MTGGRLKRVARYLDPDEPFCMTYGDGVADIDITGLIAFHRRHGRLADAHRGDAARPLRRAVAHRRPRRRASSRSRPATTASSTAASSCSIPPCCRRIAGDDTPWETEPLESLARDGELRAFRHAGFWQPMDTLRDKTTLETLWSGGARPGRSGRTDAPPVPGDDPPSGAAAACCSTGHTGFKGSWTALWLHQLGARSPASRWRPIRPRPVPAAEPGRAGLIPHRRPARSGGGRRRGDGRRPEIVLHLAAQPLVPRALAAPADTFAVNVTGAVHLLDALRDVQRLQAVLVVTSDKVYRRRQRNAASGKPTRSAGMIRIPPQRRRAKSPPRRWRGASCAPNGVAVATARAGNVIGGGDFASYRLVPDVVRAAEAGETPRLRIPQATRPWQHVLDCLGGYLAYLRGLATGRDLPPALNFGPDGSRQPTVAELAGALQQALGVTSEWTHQPAPALPERHALAIDFGLARRCLGWHDRLPGQRMVRDDRRAVPRLGRRRGHARRDAATDPRLRGT